MDNYIVYQPERVLPERRKELILCEVWRGLPPYRFRRESNRFGVGLRAVDPDHRIWVSPATTAGIDNIPQRLLFASGRRLTGFDFDDIKLVDLRMSEKEAINQAILMNSQVFGSRNLRAKIRPLSMRVIEAGWNDRWLAYEVPYTYQILNQRQECIKTDSDIFRFQSRIILSDEDIQRRTIQHLRQIGIYPPPGGKRVVIIRAYTRRPVTPLMPV